MKNILNKDVAAENTMAKVVLTYFGHGWFGCEYNENDPEDEPVLYADLYTRIDDDPAEDFCEEPTESVCTYISARVTKKKAVRIADQILSHLDTTRFGEVRYEYLLERAIDAAREEEDV